MVRYELLFLTVPEITADEASSIESQLQKLVREYEGTLISYERWGKMLLAYPIRNNDYGVYFLVRFEVASDKATALVNAVRTFCMVKLNDTVMRHLIDRLETHASLVYQRPESLEEVPGKMTETIMKEHKFSRRMQDDDVNADEQEGQI